MASRGVLGVALVVLTLAGCTTFVVRTPTLAMACTAIGHASCDYQRPLPPATLRPMCYADQRELATGEHVHGEGGALSNNVSELLSTALTGAAMYFSGGTAAP